MTGQFAVSRAGHDKGTLYVIVAEEGDFVYLSDGRGKGPRNPKKKRKKHIRPIEAFVEKTLRVRLEEGGRVWPEEIKYAIKQFESSK